MFYSLTGKIDLIEDNFVVLNCGGVGFKIFTTLTSMQNLSTLNKEEQATLYTHLNVKEDALDIYGFSQKEELDCFKLLISVSGIGPKAAISILCEMTPFVFAQSVVSGDYRPITKAQGVGAKTAQRVVLELKDKVAKSNLINQANNTNKQTTAGVQAFITASKEIDEAVEALCVLGYSKQEAQKAAENAAQSCKNDVEEIIKTALLALAKF